MLCIVFFNIQCVHCEFIHSVKLSVRSAATSWGRRFNQHKLWHDGSSVVRGDIAQVLWPHWHTHYPPYASCCCWTSKSLQAVCLDHPCSQNELHIKQQLLFGSCGWDAACRKDYFTFKDFIDTVSKLSDCTLYTCVCVCGSAPDSQHGVDLPDEVAELVHDLFQVLVLLLQLL